MLILYGLRSVSFHLRRYECEVEPVVRDSELDSMVQPKCSIAASVLEQLTQPVVGECAAQLGPRRAIEWLAEQYPSTDDRVEWARKARTAALVGSARSTCQKV